MPRAKTAFLVIVLLAATGAVLVAVGAVSIEPWGTGVGETGELRFLELAANGSNYIGFKAPDAAASSVVWTLPSADGTSGQVLQTNGSQSLSWVDQGGSAWTDVAFSAGNFAGNNDMTWSLDSSDQTTFAYKVLGKTMVVVFTLQNTTVGGTPSTRLLITIPGGKTSAKAVWNPVRLDNNGSLSIGSCYVDFGSTTISCLLISAGNFTSSTNNTDVTGEITFPIQ